MLNSILFFQKHYIIFLFYFFSYYRFYLCLISHSSGYSGLTLISGLSREVRSSFSLSQIALQLSTLLQGMRMKPSMMTLNMVSIIQLVLHGSDTIFEACLVLQPPKELEELLHHVDGHDGLSKCAVSDICKIFDLNTNDALKYRDSM